MWVDQPRAHGPGNNATRPGHRAASARQGRWNSGEPQGTAPGLEPRGMALGLEPRGMAPGLVYPSGQRMTGVLWVKRP